MHSTDLQLFFVELYGVYFAIHFSLQAKTTILSQNFWVIPKLYRICTESNNPLRTFQKNTDKVKK